LLHGLVKEGVAYWTPMLIAGMDDLAGWSPFLLASILPAANLVGIVLSRILLKRGAKNPYPILIALLCSIVLVCVLLLVCRAGLLLIAMMAVISGLCYAGNTILLGFIPMGYTKQNMVASIIGVFDFSAYVGAAVSTYVLGKVLGGVGFAPLPAIWLGASAMAAVLLCVVNGKRKKQSLGVG
jgi:sugar phosphate permease